MRRPVRKDDIRQMDMADAARVHTPNRERIRHVLTLDPTGFGVYRLPRQGRLAPHSATESCSFCVMLRS